MLLGVSEQIHKRRQFHGASLRQTKAQSRDLPHSKDFPESSDTDFHLQNSKNTFGYAVYFQFIQFFLKLTFFLHMQKTQLIQASNKSSVNSCCLSQLRYL